MYCITEHLLELIVRLVQRLVAAPLAPKKNTKGADTGLWKNLETQMRKLVHANGTDRKDPRWIEWVNSCVRPAFLISWLMFCDTTCIQMGDESHTRWLGKVCQYKRWHSLGWGGGRGGRVWSPIVDFTHTNPRQTVDSCSNPGQSFYVLFDILSPYHFGNASVLLIWIIIIINLL